MDLFKEVFFPPNYESNTCSLENIIKKRMITHWTMTQDKHSQHFVKITIESVFKCCLNDDQFEKDNSSFANRSYLLQGLAFLKSQ